MVIRHPPDRSIYMQSLLQFLKGTELKEKKLLENTIIKVLCLSWLHLFICLHLLTWRGRLKVQWDWTWEAGQASGWNRQSGPKSGWFRNPSNQDEKCGLLVLTIFDLLLLHPGDFSSRAHRNCLEQADSEQLLQFFTKSKMAWFGISDAILYLKSVESVAAV